MESRMTTDPTQPTGAAIEAASSSMLEDIRRVLTGDLSYDTLSEPAQTIVRAIWDESIAIAITELDLAAEFEAAGVGYVEADEAGNLIQHLPSKPSSP